MTDLYVDRRGDGPPVVLIHAGVGDHRMWDEVAADLATTHTVLVYDVRGYGRSPDPVGDYFDHEDVLAILDAAAVDRAVFVGASNGGRIAADTAVTAPDRVAGLVLVGAALPGLPPDEALAPLVEEQDRLVEAGDLDGVARIDLQVWLAGVGRDLEELDAELVARATPWFREANARELAGAPGEPQAIDPPLRERLVDLTAPTLVLVGEHDQPRIWEAARRYVTAAPAATGPVTVPGTAHLPMIEDPAALVNHLRRHLADIGWV